MHHRTVDERPCPTRGNAGEGSPHHRCRDRAGHPAGPGRADVHRDPPEPAVGRGHNVRANLPAGSTPRSSPTCSAAASWAGSYRPACAPTWPWTPCTWACGPGPATATTPPRWCITPTGVCSTWRSATPNASPRPVPSPRLGARATARRLHGQIGLVPPVELETQHHATTLPEQPAQRQFEVSIKPGT